MRDEIQGKRLDGLENSGAAGCGGRGGRAFVQGICVDVRVGTSYAAAVALTSDSSVQVTVKAATGAGLPVLLSYSSSAADTAAAPIAPSSSKAPLYYSYWAPQVERATPSAAPLDAQFTCFTSTKAQY